QWAGSRHTTELLHSVLHGLVSLLVLANRQRGGVRMDSSPLVQHSELIRVILRPRLHERLHKRALSAEPAPRDDNRPTVPPDSPRMHEGATSCMVPDIELEIELEVAEYFVEIMRSHQTRCA